MSSQNPKKHLRRGGISALASAALLLGSTLAATPAQAVPDDGKGEVILKVVDAAGKATGGMVLLYGTESTTGGPGGTYDPVAGTYTYTVDEGRYGVVTMTPWGGLTCAGISPCDYLTITSTGTATVTGVLDVTDSETPVTYTVKTAAPAVLTGGNTVGQDLRVDWSSGMDSLISLFGSTGGGYGPAVQWLRDGAVLADVTGNSYTMQPADVGHTVAARLTYPNPILWSMYGGQATPITLAGRKVGKVKTHTTVEVFRSAITAGRSSGFRADVTSTGASPTGKVRIVIGKLKITKTLRNGSIRGVLPKSLKAGKYTIVATYLGSSTYLGSKGKDKLTVKPATK